MLQQLNFNNNLCKTNILVAAASTKSGESVILAILYLNQLKNSIQCFMWSLWDLDIDAHRGQGV